MVETPRGILQARKVVHANNAYVSGLLPEYAKSIIPCKGICCHITVPKDGTAPPIGHSYIVRTEDGFLDYLIARPDGSIIVGGASATFRSHKDQWYNNVDDGKLIGVTMKEWYYDGFMQRTFRGWENSDAKIESIWTGSEFPLPPMTFLKLNEADLSCSNGILLRFKPSYRSCPTKVRPIHNRRVQWPWYACHLACGKRIGRDVEIGKVL